MAMGWAAGMKRLPELNIKNEFLPFYGGLDTETPALSMSPGTARSAQNFEQAVNGGYQPIKGYERYDGRTSPSSVTYAILYATGIDLTATIGGTLTGVASAATGTIIAVTSTYFVLTRYTGTFVVENVTVLGVVVGEASGAHIVEGIADGLLNATYKALAADEYRADITAVPGSGPVRGVWRYAGVTYAFRDNAGGTACAMYKSTTAGWVEVTFGTELLYESGGSPAVGEIIPEGSVITGSNSGATATVQRVVTRTGTWVGLDAAGSLILSGQVGNFNINDNYMVGGVQYATASAWPGGVDYDSHAIAFSYPGGRFEFMNYNFGGGLETQRMYGVDGKNRGFEFDGTTLVPITTGMPVDTPSHLCGHKWHLFFSFYGSVQHSAPGEPYVWSVILGAAEIGIGDTITGFMSQSGSQDGGALAVFSRNEIAILYGTNVSDWNMASFKQDAGAKPNTIQVIGGTMFLDDRGIINLAASQAYGNFEDAVFSKLIHSWLNEKKGLEVASCCARDKNQYRLFFSDGFGLYITMDNQKVAGMLPVLFDDPVVCCCSVEDSIGTEAMFFGDAAGYVYQMDKGTSFDGDDIDAFLDFGFYPFKSPNVIKRFRKMRLEVFGLGYSELYTSYEIDYNSQYTAQPTETQGIIGLVSSVWDSGLLWDAGITWDGQNVMPLSIPMMGSGLNLSVKIRSSSNKFEPVRASGIQIQYTSSRIER